MSLFDSIPDPQTKRRCSATTYLYSPDEAAKTRRRANTCLYAALAFLGLGLIACICLCFHVRPDTAARRLAETISISTVSGWAAILLINAGYLPLRGTAQHAERLNGTEPQELTGMLVSRGRLFRIPGSIPALTIRIQVGEEMRSLHVDAEKQHLLPADGTEVRVEYRGSFITGVEVLHDA